MVQEPVSGSHMQRSLPVLLARLVHLGAIADQRFGTAGVAERRLVSAKGGTLRVFDHYTEGERRAASAFNILNYYKNVLEECAR